MKEFKDSAIREMLRRRHAAVPPLSDDFEEKLFSAYEQRKKEQLALTSHTRVPHSRRHLILWPSIAAAATVALLLTLLPASEPQHNAVIAQVQPEVANQSPKAAQPETSEEPAPVAIPHKAERKAPRHSEPATQKVAPAKPELAPVAEEEPAAEAQPFRSRIDYVAANRDNMRSRISEQFETPFSSSNNEKTDKS